MEYKLTQREFDQLSRLIYEKSGISLHEGKRELVRARLSKRLRETGLSSFQAYYDYVLREVTGQELLAMLDSISTNLTSFFREPAHFNFLRRELIPRLVGRRGPGSRRLWVWSAGCSSGEEPYSVALCILEALPNLLGWDVKILATDISTQALDTARRGVYKAERLAEVPPEILARRFQRGVKEWAGHYRIKEEVRSLVDFRRSSLLEGPPVAGQFEIIFCRNVMIYFDATVQARVIATFQERLQPGGCLFIGHSESLARVRHGLHYLRPAVYCKEEEHAGGQQRLSN
jgi:chemotaxis protein methyltransferase CheR